MHARSDAVVLAVLLDFPIVSGPHIDVADVGLAVKGDDDELCEEKKHEEVEASVVRTALQAGHHRVHDVTGVEHLGETLFSLVICAKGE